MLRRAELRLEILFGITQWRHALPFRVCGSSRSNFLQ